MTSKSKSRTLTDHNEIRRWAEERDAKPSAVRSTESQDDVGIIRLDFPGYSGADSLEEISWDDWFDKFEENELALVVQTETANGEKSNFNKLVSRTSVTADTEESNESGASSHSRSKTSASKIKGTKRRTSKAPKKAA